MPIASKPCFVVAAIESNPVPYVPAALAPVGEIDAATATSMFGSLYGFNCRRASCRVNQSVCLRHGLAAEQRHDRVERLVHARALHVGGDAEHVRVGGELSGPATEHGAPAREVVEQHEAIREHQRVVVGERVHAAAEPDVLGAGRGRGDEHLGRRDDLEAARVVLADPDLVEAEAVEVLDQVEVALECERRVLPGRVERGHEESEAHAAIRPELDRSVNLPIPVPQFVRSRTGRCVRCPQLARLCGAGSGGVLAELRVDPRFERGPLS